VATLTQKESHKKKAKRRYMSKDDLLVKYNGDKGLVEDLIKRKAADNQWMWNPEFPDNEDHRMFLCFDGQEEVAETSVEKATALKLCAEVAPETEEGKKAISGLLGGAAAWALPSGSASQEEEKTKKKRKNTSGPAAAAAQANTTPGGQAGEPPRKQQKTQKDPEQTCRQRLRELGALKTECKSWPAVLDNASCMLPSMKEALKKDMALFVDRLQEQYDKIENAIVSNGNQEMLAGVLKEADALIEEYGSSSELCRKLKPKAQPKPKGQPKAKAKAS
jgi:hypothetical protein